jgi:chemotaxis protein MotB
MGQGAPSIIKRKKVIAAGGHHGGAWKVAYADFVTAMMAFFLLMWLLNATTEQQKKGLADYFAPNVPLSRVSGGGSDLFGGDSPASTDSMASTGEPVAAILAGLPAFPESEAAAAALAALRELEDVLLGRGGESLLSDEALRHVVTRLTDEGLVIEVFAMEGAPIFEQGTARPTAITAEITGVVAELARIVENAVAVAGHVPAEVGPARAMTAAGPRAWALSTARADAVRRALEGGGLAPSRVSRVAGHADRVPAVSNPGALRNDRIEIILLIDR